MTALELFNELKGRHTSSTTDNQEQTKPVLVQLVGGEDLEPFEKAMLALTREGLEISKRTYKIAILAFLAATAAAVFVGIQVKEMSYQSQIMGSQSESAAAGAAVGELNTRQQLKIAGSQADAAAKNAKAAQDNVAVIRAGVEESSKRSKEALDATINNFRQEQRAWVGLDVGPDPGHPIDISELTVRFNPVQFTVIAGYRMKNFGHGPAFELATEGFITTDERVLEENAMLGCQMTLVPQMLKLNPTHGSMLFPNATLDNAFGGVPRKPFPAELVPDATVVFFIGCVTYKDQFGTSHWTRFCFTTPPFTQDTLTKIDKNTPLVPYAMYNDTDYEEQKKKK